MGSELSFKKSCVVIFEGERFVKLISPMAKKTSRPEVLTDIGLFSALFKLDLTKYKEPVLVSGTDGVGTKLKIAFMMDKHDTVGIDLVAMCVNDILLQGATPLFMLDYISMGKLDLNKAVDIVKGIAAGCKEASCSLIGGETAEMPGFYAKGEYDLAGFVVGIADHDDLLEGTEIAVGNQLIGIGSSGLHSNGYSLVRKIFFKKLKMSVEDYVEEFGRTLGEELLEPARIYAKTITTLRKNYRIYGISHITGGGLIDNLPRILPKQCKAVIESSSWTPQPIFQYLQKAGNIPREDMLRTFNNGLGLVIVVNEKDCGEVLLHLKGIKETACRIGSVKSRANKESSVQ